MRAKEITKRVVCDRHGPQACKQTATITNHTFSSSAFGHRVASAGTYALASLSFLCVIIPKSLDNSGITSFSYLDLKSGLGVPEGVNDNVLIRTWFEHSRRAVGASAKVVRFNAALHKFGPRGCGKLTYRNTNVRYAFTLAKKMDPNPENFSRTLLRHGIDHFVEMSIELHNTIMGADVPRVDKVLLVNSNGVL